MAPTVKIQYEMAGEQPEKHVGTKEEAVGNDVVKNPCLEYAGVVAVADDFLSGLMEESREKTKRWQEMPTLEVLDKETSTNDSSVETFVEYFNTFSSWPTIGEFNQELGAAKVQEYLSTWFYEEDWLYSVNLLHKQSDNCSDYYIYECVWSIPTKEYPIPQATASVFFTIGVSRVQPPSCLVDVHYIFEGNTYRFKPFKHRFQETWLFNIVDAKLQLFKTLRF